MKPWGDFYDYYLSDLPGLTSFSAANQLRMAAQEFCQRSKALVQTQEPITTTQESLYDFELPRSVSLVQLIAASLDGQDIHVLNTDKPRVGVTSIQALSSKQFEISPAAAAGLAIVTRCAVKPSNTATGVDDWLWEQYAESIAYGAKFRLMTQMEKPYSNPQLGALNKAQFEEAIGRATVEAARARSKAPIRTKAHFM